MRRAASGRLGRREELSRLTQAWGLGEVHESRLISARSSNVYRLRGGSGTFIVRLTPVEVKSFRTVRAETAACRVASTGAPVVTVVGEPVPARFDGTAFTAVAFEDLGPSRHRNLTQSLSVVLGRTLAQMHRALDGHATHGLPSLAPAAVASASLVVIRRWSRELGVDCATYERIAEHASHPPSSAWLVTGVCHGDFRPGNLWLGAGTEASSQLGAKRRLVKHPRRRQLPVQRPGVQRPPHPVTAADPARNQHMGVQLRVPGPR